MSDLVLSGPIRAATMATFDMASVLTTTSIFNYNYNYKNIII